MRKAEFEKPGVDVIELINTGGKILDATLPWINAMIKKIQESGDPTNINTPKGRTYHILQNEALDRLQQQKIDLLEGYVQQLIDKGIVEA